MDPPFPIALAALAVGQMGIHLVFFLHLTTAPDNTNNALALAFGVLICGIIVFGSVWIMAHLNHNLMPMNQLLAAEYAAIELPEVHAGFPKSSYRAPVLLRYARPQMGTAKSQQHCFRARRRTAGNRN